MKETIVIIASLLLAGGVGADPSRRLGLLAERDCLATISLIVDHPGKLPYEMFHVLYAEANPPARGANTEADNVEYLDLAASARAADHYFLHVTLKPLKQLNESVFTGETESGKKDVDAARNLFRLLLYENILAHPKLKKGLRSQFADFKTFELAFAKGDFADRAEFDRAVAELMSATQIHFDLAMIRYTRDNKELQQRMREVSGLVGDFRAWHLSGVGDGNPDHAAFPARFSVQDFDRERGVASRPRAYSPKEIEAHLGKIEGDLRPAVVREFRDVPGMMRKYEGTEDYVLSDQAIDILRAVPAKDLKEYVAYVKKEFERRLGVKFHPTNYEDQIVLLRDYYAAADLMQPPIRVAKRVPVNLSRAAHGAVTIDFVGVNVTNMYHTMGMLAQAHRAGAKADRILEMMREGEGLATKRLALLKANFQKAVRAAGLKGEIQFSGDDGAVILDHPATSEEKEKLYTALFALDSQGGSYRPVWVPGMRNESKVLDGGLMTRESVLGETIEKRLRKSLYGKVPSTDLGKVLFSVTPDPSTRTAQITVVGLNPAPQIRTLAERWAQEAGVVPDGYRISGVTTLNLSP